MRAKILLLLLSFPSFFLCTETAFGQKSHPPKMKVYNALVHVTTQSKKIVGVLTDVGDSAIHVSSKDREVRINASTIKKIVIKRKGSVGRSVLAFTLIGITAGAIAGSAQGDSPCDPPASWIACDPVTASDKALAGAVVFGLTGSLVGWVVGSIAKERIAIGESQLVFEENVALLRKYSLSRTPQ